MNERNGNRIGYWIVRSYSFLGLRGGVMKTLSVLSVLSVLALTAPNADAGPNASSVILTLNANIAGPNEVSAPSFGETFDVRRYVPEAASRQIFGYSITFDNTGNDFLRNFEISSARNWQGSNLLLTNNSTSESEGRPVPPGKSRHHRRRTTPWPPSSSLMTKRPCATP